VVRTIHLYFLLREVQGAGLKASQVGHEVAQLRCHSCGWNIPSVQWRRAVVGIECVRDDFAAWLELRRSWWMCEN
jgi:hypothetical protein